MMTPPPNNERPPHGWEEAWSDLRSHFELSRGFSLIFLFFSGISTSILFKKRVEERFLHHTPPLQILSSSDPTLLLEETMEFIRRPEAHQPLTEAPLWIEAAMGHGNAWDCGRDILLARINEQRDLLRKSVKRPVIIALPGSFQQRARTIAPDLWSIRDLALEVGEGGTAKSSIFISYAHADESWRDRIVKFLAPLGREFRFEVWSDQRIDAGASWREEVEAAIQKASAALFLVSPDFLNAKFIMDEEVPPLLHRGETEGITIIPIILRPCPWKEIGWLSEIQVLPSGGTPLSAMVESEWEVELTKISVRIAGKFKDPALSVLDNVDLRPVGMNNTLPPRVSLAKLPSTSPELFGREKELELLDVVWDSSSINLVSLVAFGGVGKTALVNRWLLEMGKENYRGAERVLGYSFYSQGAGEGKQASADEFIRFALEWFGDPMPEKGSPWEKGERLAELAKETKTLLILDGVESLQYPPGPMEGRLKDPALQALVREMARHNPGLLVLSTQIAVDDLKDFEGHSAEKVELESLSKEAGGEFLKSLGVEGTQKELEKAAEEVKGHALALALMGNYLKTVHEGDVRRRNLIPKLTEDETQGGHARRVMEFYEKWFAEENKPELDLLYILGLFDRPATEDAIGKLKEKPVITGLTERLAGLSHAKWQTILQHLRDLRLIAQKDEHSPNTLDCHPLVREHFGEKLEKGNPKAWKEAHFRLYEYYKNLPEKELPDTLEEMGPLFLAVSHGCRAGKGKEVYDEVFRKRISRGDQAFCLNQLGAFGSVLSTLTAFFKTPWDCPSEELPTAYQAFVLNAAGFTLCALGRLREAAQPMEAGLQAVIKRGNWGDAAIGSGTLSGLFLDLGEVHRAVEFGRMSVELADRSPDGYLKTLERTALADVLLQWGRMGEAEKLFVEAEEMQKKDQPIYPQLYSIGGYRYCCLLLEKGRFGEARERGEKTLEWVTEAGRLPDIALDHLTLGGAGLLESLEMGKGDFSQAEEHLNLAVEGFRKAGHQNDIPRSLLARAALWRAKGEFPRAERDLNEAGEIAERGEMKLHLADAALERTRLLLVMGKKEEARESLERGRKLVEETEYHLRDKEIEALGQRTED